MQAAKQLSLGPKNAVKATSGPPNASNNSNDSKNSSNNNNNNNNNGKNSSRRAEYPKSVAQRVMDMVANGNNSNVGSESSNNNSPQTNQETKSILQSSTSSSSNSAENDQEVENITSRVANFDLAGSNENSLNNTNPAKKQQNNPLLSDPIGQENFHQHQTLTSTSKQSSSSSSSLLLCNSQILASPTQDNNNRPINPMPLQPNNSGLVSCESVFRQAISKDSRPQTTADTIRAQTLDNFMLNNGNILVANCDASISLDTKVPHPSSRSDFHGLHSNEEVSYYNDQAIGLSLEPRAGGSLDNSARPKFIAATMEQRLGACLPKSAASCQQLRQYKMTQHCRQSNSREYLNDVVEDNDESYSRYGNAMVEKRTQQEHFTEDLCVANNDQQLILKSDSLSVPTSPKAKSAPATPCNITPTAFHQHTSNLNSPLNPSPANTLPSDLKRKISATCRVLPSSIEVDHSGQSDNVKTHLDELIKRGETALDSKDFPAAIDLFSRCIDMAQNNQNIVYLEGYKLYGQRAEAHFNLGHYVEAIEDSMAARQLNPKWMRAYYLQGKSEFLIGRFNRSLAVFSFGLSKDLSNKLLFDALVESALESDLKQTFELKFKKLRSLNLDMKPFLVASVIGQELLSKGHSEHAAIILESALKMEPDNKKFRSSILSTLALAHCMRKHYEKAIPYMEEELEVEKELEDVSEQCRVWSNLGYAYYKVRELDKSLDAHREQLRLAMKTHLFTQASMALNALGHVHAARNDFSNALTSHTRCLDILKQLGDNDYSQYKELLAIGHINSMHGDFKSAEDKYNEAIQLLKGSRKISSEEYQVGCIMVEFNMACLALKKQSFTDAKNHYNEVRRLTQGLPDPKRTLYEMRAANGMGQTHRLFKRFDEAQGWFEKQLQLAETLGDQVGQSQALCNLGMTFQHSKDYNSARSYFKRNLKLVGDNPLLLAYAHSYMGNMYFQFNRYAEAQTHYETSLSLFKEFNHCLAEVKTIELNMAEAKTIELNMASVHERVGHGSDVNVVASNSTNQRKVMMAS